MEGVALPIAITCPGCGHGYQVSSKLAGQTARCKHCDVRFAIAGPGSAKRLEEQAISSPPGEALFAGMNLEEMLGPKDGKRAPVSPEQSRGFMLPEERQAMAAAAAAAPPPQAEPLPSMLIEGLGSATTTVRRPGGFKFNLAWQGLPLSSLSGLLGRISPLGLTMIVSGLAFSWVIAHTPDQAAASGSLGLLPLAMSAIGVLVVLAGLFAVTQPYEGHFPRFMQFCCLAGALALAVCLMTLSANPDAARSVAMVAIILTVVGGLAWLAAGLWSIVAVFKENAGIATMLIVAMVGGTAMNLAFQEPILRLLIDLVVLVLMIVALATCWGALARPFAVGICGLLVMLTAAAFVGFERKHSDSRVMAMGDAAEQASMTGASAPSPTATGLAQAYTEFHDFALRPPAGWTRTNWGWAPTPSEAGPTHMRGAKLFVEPYAALPKDAPLPPLREAAYMETVETQTQQINNMEVQMVRLRPRRIGGHTIAYLFGSGDQAYAVKVTWDDHATPEQVAAMRESAATLVRRSEPVYAQPPAKETLKAWDLPVLDGSEAIAFLNLRLHVPRQRAKLQITDRWTDKVELQLGEGDAAVELVVSQSTYAIDDGWPMVRLAGPHARINGVEKGEYGSYRATGCAVTYGTLQDRPSVRVEYVGIGASDRSWIAYLGPINASRHTFTFTMTFRGDARTGPAAANVATLERVVRSIEVGDEPPPAAVARDTRRPPRPEPATVAPEPESATPVAVTSSPVAQATSPAVPQAPPPPLVLRPSATALRQLGDAVRIGERWSFRPPTDLVGRMDGGGRNGQWRGSGQLQRVVGIDVSVRPADNLTDPVQLAPTGLKQLRTHGQWTPLADAQIDRLDVGGILVTRARMPTPANARIVVTHYVAIDGDQVLSFTARYDPSRPLQRDVLEAAVLSLQRRSP